MTDPDRSDPDPLSSPSNALSSQRTAMSLERSFMSADRTLMSVIRTALSLIGFGFTIFQFFGKIALESNGKAITSAAARHFGSALVLLGIGLLAAGLVSHFRQFQGFRRRRAALYAARLLRSDVRFETTPTMVVGFLLLLLGVVAAFGMILRAGPLQ